MKLLKCTFVVTSEKLLRFVVRHKGIGPTEIEKIKDIRFVTSIYELRGFKPAFLYPQVYLRPVQKVSNVL